MKLIWTVKFKHSRRPNTRAYTRCKSFDDILDANGFAKLLQNDPNTTFVSQEWELETEF